MTNPLPTCLVLRSWCCAGWIGTTAGWRPWWVPWAPTPNTRRMRCRSSNTWDASAIPIQTHMPTDASSAGSGSVNSGMWHEMGMWHGNTKMRYTKNETNITFKPKWSKWDTSSRLFLESRIFQHPCWAWVKLRNKAEIWDTYRWFVISIRTPMKRD